MTLRRDLIGSVILLAVVALLVLRPWEGGEQLAGSVEAEVVRVVDGDTVEARVGGDVERVRLIGVDTPESVAPGRPVECFGPEASRFAKRLMDGRQVRLVLGEERRDHYGRLLAYVYLGDAGDERFVNAALVRGGYARTLTIPPNDRYAPLLRRLELRAARAGRGLWTACAP